MASDEKLFKMQQKYSKKLDKQELKLQKYSGREQQLQFKFTKQQEPNGNFHTKVNLIRGEKNENYDTKGIIHKIANQKYRLVGDVPSITDFNPETTAEKALKTTANVGKYVLKATSTVALSAESAGFKITNSIREADIKKQKNIVGEYNRYENRGIIHKTINKTYKIAGEDFSIKKKIKNYTPKSISGKAIKTVTSTGYITSKTAINIAMAAETKLVGGNEQFKLKFIRQQDENGKFKTKVSIIRDEKNYKLKNKGVLHRIVNQKSRFTGDVPSLKKGIDTAFQKWKPKTIKGKTAKLTLKSSEFLLEKTINTSLKAGLTVESGITKVSDIAKDKGKKKLQEGWQKYKREANDDVNKAVIEVSKVSFDGIKGIRNHFVQKNQHKLYKARYRLKKYSMLESKDSNKKELKQKKRDIKADKTQKKIYKIKFKSEKLNSNNVKHKKYRLKKLKTKNNIKLKKNNMKQIKNKAKFNKKDLKNMKRLTSLSKPTLLVLRPEKYAVKNITASSYQKAINSDPDNDFIKAADMLKKEVTDRALERFKPSKRRELAEKKKKKLREKENQENIRLRKQESKLQKKDEKIDSKDNDDNDSNNKKKDNKDDKKKKIRSKQILKMFAIIAKSIAETTKALIRYIILHLAPILLVLLVLILVICFIMSIFTNSSFVLGTYAAQDYDLSMATEYYTKLAYDMNQKILKVSTDDWKDGLREFGVTESTLRNYKDNPDVLIWGRSSYFDYDPIWDYDPYKLWSFLCAYNLNVDDINNDKDIKFWKFNDSTKDLLKELFNEQYEFKYMYDNHSDWVRYDDGYCRYFGGGSCDGTDPYGNPSAYYMCESNVQKWNLSSFTGNSDACFRLKPISYTGEISSYIDSYGYMYINSDYRILDANNNYKLTGYSLYDHRYYNGYSTPFYYSSGENAFGYFANGNWHDRIVTRCTGGIEANFVISNIDSRNWTGITGGNDFCLYGYYENYWYDKNCNLYYNVEQKKTFEQAILDKLGSMDNSTERIEYYNLLVGNEELSMHGNHQIYNNIFEGESLSTYINNGNILNWFGYDMQGWNIQHCNIATSNGGDGLHKGIDISYPGGAAIYSPLDCKIDEYDAGGHVVILRQNNVNYWYGGKRDTKIYITNITLNSGYSEGSEIKAGENFATATGDRKCILRGETNIQSTTYSNLPYEYVHIAAYIDTDGYGWDYVDPILLLY